MKINNYFIWDKISPINGCIAKNILLNSEFKNNTVVFFTDNNNVPRIHDFVEHLKLDYNMYNCTDAEICQIKLNQIILEQVALETQANEEDKLREELDVIRLENEALKEKLSFFKTKDIK